MVVFLGVIVDPQLQPYKICTIDGIHFLLDRGDNIFPHLVCCWAEGYSQLDDEYILPLAIALDTFDNFMVNSKLIRFAKQFNKL